jgi:hypothetical protein
MKCKTLSLAGIAVAMYAIPAFAHHSFSMFDDTKIATIKGTVKEFDWINPHIWLVVVSNEEKTKGQTWAFEGPATGGMAKKGWLPKTLTPGMIITTTFRPMKNGDPGGQVRSVELSDGKIMPIQ